jgi:serine protease Do
MSRSGFRRRSAPIALMALLVFAWTGTATAQERDQSWLVRRSPTVVVVEKTAPTVVSITAQIAQRVPMTPWDELFNRDDGQGRVMQGRSEGSGVIIHPAGYLVTNNHVVGGAVRIVVSFTSGTEHTAQIVGTDPGNDIAILKIDAPGPFAAVPLGRSDDLMLGEAAIALGNPFGLHGSVTAGIVSAVNRRIDFNGREVFSDFIQTSAVINPGNSGGPLVNINGELIGINVAIHSRGPGIGFAIPVNRVREVIHRVLDTRVTKRATIGIDVAYNKEDPGAVITAVEPNGPAQSAGLVVGDVIQAIDEQPILHWIDFQARVSQMTPGEKATLEVLRRGKRLKLPVAFDEMPASPTEQAVFDWLGFSFADLPAELRRGMGGVVVTDVDRRSSAETIGVKAGDVLFAIDGYTLDSKQKAMRVAQNLRGRRETLELQLVRDGNRMRGRLLVEPE